MTRYALAWCAFLIAVAFVACSVSAQHLATTAAQRPVYPAGLIASPVAQEAGR